MSEKSVRPDGSGNGSGEGEGEGGGEGFLARALARREFILSAAAGTVVSVFGGNYALAQSNDPRQNLVRPDGRPRVPPGQRLLTALRPMGGDPGDPSPATFRLRVSGECDAPF